MEKGMVEELDETVCKQMSGLVELLTTSGKPSLSPEVMKKFKKICRYPLFMPCNFQTSIKLWLDKFHNLMLIPF